MAYIKECVVQLTMRDMNAMEKNLGRAYDSRSCASLIKEGYQAVKKVVTKTSKLRSNRNEAWALTEEALASAATHRDMPLALQLMVIGFENLNADYHGKVGFAIELLEHPPAMHL